MTSSRLSPLNLLWLVACLFISPPQVSAQESGATMRLAQAAAVPPDTDAPPTDAPPATLDDLSAPTAPKPATTAKPRPVATPQPRRTVAAKQSTPKPTSRIETPTPRPPASAKPTAPRATTPEAAVVAKTRPSITPAAPLNRTSASAVAPSNEAPPLHAPPANVEAANAPPADVPPATVDAPLPSVATAPAMKMPRHTDAANSTVAANSAPITNDDLQVEDATAANNSWPPFLYQALYASLLVAVVCSYLGLFVVLRRIVFVGVALAELSSAGIALALYFSFAPLLGSVAFTLIGIGLFSLRLAPRRVPSESFIGIIYAIAGALAILLIAKSVGGETHMLKLMQGDVLTVEPGETRQMLLAFVAIAALHLAFAKEFVLVSFDRDAAATLGFGAARWEWLLLMTIGAAISFAIRATGVLLTSTMLVLPAVTALLLTRHLRAAMIAAPLLATGPVVLGLHLSLVLDVPASAMIVALSFGQLLPALAWEAFGNRRG